MKNEDVRFKYSDGMHPKNYIGDHPNSNLGEVEFDTLISCIKETPERNRTRGQEYILYLHNNTRQIIKAYDESKKNLAALREQNEKIRQINNHIGVQAEKRIRKDMAAYTDLTEKYNQLHQTHGETLEKHQKIMDNIMMLENPQEATIKDIVNIDFHTMTPM